MNFNKILLIKNNLYYILEGDIAIQIYYRLNHPMSAKLAKIQI